MPRLIRWQAQDEDSARLRDQLRQSAELWQERSQQADLLWTGKSFREYQVWRENYPGGLSATEQNFSDAMEQNAGRRKRRRRLAVAAALARDEVAGPQLLPNHPLAREHVQRTAHRAAGAIVLLGKLALRRKRMPNGQPPALNEPAQLRRNLAVFGNSFSTADHWHQPPTAPTISLLPAF